MKQFIKAFAKWLTFSQVLSGNSKAAMEKPTASRTIKNWIIGKKLDFFCRISQFTSIDFQKKESVLASHNEQVHRILKRDVDPEFLETVSIALAWNYHDLFVRLDQKVGISNDLKQERFSSERGFCAVGALVQACKKHGVPYNFRSLPCNGQHKLFVKIGRVVLIQEPMLELQSKPRASDYKVELAGAHGFIQQLELNLGDQPQRILDWSGSVLSVLLHAPAGPKFSADHKSLGGLMLGVPNVSYSEWSMRLDLYRVAMNGFDPVADGVIKQQEPLVQQRDQVRVKLRARRAEGDS